MTEPSQTAPWRLAAADPARVEALVDQSGLSPVCSRILVSRGIDTPDKVVRYLRPALESDWEDPGIIPGMPEAAARVTDAVRAQRNIVVFGDFDLDGISAAAVATRGLRALGARVTAVVPHRFNEGYGLSKAALDRVMTHGPQLVITVDCGISSAVEVDQLRERGVDVVVTDHHEPGELVPQGVPVADPKISQTCASRNLSGSGVALKLVEAVGAQLGKPELWRELTDLATLGTIADIVPLVAENRALVAHGIALMRTRPRLCIAALAAAAGASTASMSSETVAYALAPRLNAPGRMSDPTLALELLLADDPVRAEELATELDALNKRRQEVEAELSQAALALAERTWSEGERALVLAGEGWHEGVKGIVASRLCGMYRLPTFLFTIEDGVAKGSGRSVGTVDLFEALESCSEALTRFGGHAAAVGLALPAADLPRFRELLFGHLDALPAEQFTVERTVDAEVELADVSVTLAAELDTLEPFGHGNPRPLLAVRGIFMNDRARVGRSADHFKFTAFDGRATVPAIAFRARDIEALTSYERTADVAFELQADEWRGRARAQMIVRDIAVEPDIEPDAPAAELVTELFEKAEAILAREEYLGIEEAPQFHTKLVGVTFEDRQDAVAALAPGTPLRLVRQPHNEFDVNACALFDPRGNQIGFLNRRLAAVLAPAIDRGATYDVEVTDVTGGEDGKSSGVNVLVSRRDALAEQVDEQAARAQARVELGALSAADLEHELVSRFIGDGALHPAQAQSLSALQAGERTLTVMATGRGKSLIFHIHAAKLALRDARASVFVYPLRALVADQAFHLQEAFTRVGLNVITLTGEASQAQRDETFEGLGRGDVDVVLTTPEFLVFHAQRFATTERVGFVVVDEAHHVGLARAGHRPAYARLGEALELLGDPAVLAVTATASDEVAAQIRLTLGIERLVLDPTVRENLHVEDVRDYKDKDAYLAKLVASGGKSVIYVNSRDKSVQVARMLRKRVPDLGFKIAFYNGGLTRTVRHAVEHAFRDGSLQVVVATSAFGEGVNIPDIRNVVLYHLPFNDVEFNQMAGRAGRDGALARIHLLFGERDARLNEVILSSLAPERDDLAALYRVLLDIQGREGNGFEITNAELAERASRLRRGFSLDERGVSTGLGIFRELGLVTGEGHGAYRQLSVTPSPAKVDLASSVRYAEGIDEVEQFARFRRWALDAAADVLLHRFNRPILPTHD